MEYTYAKQICDNLKMSSDNITLEECYRLCANKKHLSELENPRHQVIWGRRGTGKTTLQKAFTYYINNVKKENEICAIYIMIARMIPTLEELELTGYEKRTLPVYIFSKLIAEIINQLEIIYNEKQCKLKRKDDEKFVKNYVDLIDIINNYRSKIVGLSVSVDDLHSIETNTATKANYSIGAGLGSGFSPIFLKIKSEIKEKFEKTYKHTHSVFLKGTLKFSIETQTVAEKLEEMLSALGIKRLYISIDEYAEIDKVSQFSVQSDVAQLIKQVFFKSTFFSVKIATIWSHSKLHNRGENRIQGIEYKQDIFPGPDLDIMFMKNNEDVINYFKSLLFNTYALNKDVPKKEVAALSEFFIEKIFGIRNFKCLICGSQGVSRAFVVMVDEYLTRFIENDNQPLKISTVYDMVKSQYLEDVRAKIPYLTIGNCIDEFVKNKMSRYFLIERDDYNRCKSIIKHLASKGAFVQLPGHLTNFQIRNNYKLFIINYGYYLEVVENHSYKKGIKTLSEDGKLSYEDMLFPPCPEALLIEPNEYCVHLPENSENEIYCPKCQTRFTADEKSKKVNCPKCNNEISKFDYFASEVSI